jgi:hypothetical protein
LSDPSLGQEGSEHQSSRRSSKLVYPNCYQLRGRSAKERPLHFTVELIPTPHWIFSVVSLALSNSLKDLPKCWLKAEKSLSATAFPQIAGHHASHLSGGRYEVSEGLKASATKGRTNACIEKT